MGVDLYYTPGSPPCRAALLTVKALDLPVNLKLLDLKNGEHLKPEFLKINPRHSVPTLVDGDLVLWESRAIITYLVNNYGKGSTLYPEDPKSRALVDQALYFDIGTLYQNFGDYFYPQIFADAPADESKLLKVHEALQTFDFLLEGRRFAAGDHMTVADLSLVAIVSTIPLANIDIKYSNVNRWFDLVKSTAPGYQKYNEKGLQIFKQNYINK